MFDKYKDKLLDERMEELSDSERISYDMQKIKHMIFQSSILNTVLFSGSVIFVYLAFIFTTTDRINLLRSAGLYSASWNSIGTLILLLFVVAILIYLIVDSKKKSDEDSEEFEEYVEDLLEGEE